MKTFQPRGLLCDYNTIEQYGLNIDGFIKMMVDIPASRSQ